MYKRQCVVSSATTVAISTNELRFHWTRCMSERWFYIGLGAAIWRLEYCPDWIFSESKLDNRPSLHRLQTIV
jgi:hypothetical protein